MFTRGVVTKSFDINNETGMSNDEIRNSIFNSRIDYLLQNFKESASIADADSSICTLTLGTTDALLTEEVKYTENPEKFFHSLAIEEFVTDSQIRLATVSKLDTGNINDDYSQVLPVWEFWTDAQDIALNIRRTAEFTIQIDDVFYEKSVSYAPDIGVNLSPQLINFDDKRTRKITINLSTGSGGFRGVSVLPTDSVWCENHSFKAVHVGDSFSTGTDPNIGGLSYANIIFDRFSLHNSMTSADGGTGFANDASGVKYNYVDRISDVTDVAPDLILVSATVNDNEYTNTTLESKITEWYDTVRAALPSAMIIVLGAQGRTDDSTTTMEAKVFETFDSFSDANVINVQTTSADDPMITGTGNDSSLQSDGNADIYICDDGTHYNEDGHVFAGNATSQRILTALRSSRF